MRVVVVGGLGNFGARICTRLALEPEIEIVATSRHMSKGGDPASIQTAMLDINAHDLCSKIQSLTPELVIHCAGPFQGQDYRVALASLACGAHYVDLADGRGFVTGFIAAVGPAAEAAKRIAITGASTKEIMARIGHTSPVAALRYQHATEDRDRAIADALSGLASVPMPIQSATA